MSLRRQPSKPTTKIPGLPTLRVTKVTRVLMVHLIPKIRVCSRKEVRSSFLTAAAGRKAPMSNTTEVQKQARNKKMVAIKTMSDSSRAS